MTFCQDCQRVMAKTIKLEMNCLVSLKRLNNIKQKLWELRMGYKVGLLGNVYCTYRDYNRILRGQG